MKIAWFSGEQYQISHADFVSGFSENSNFAFNMFFHSVDDLFLKLESRSKVHMYTEVLIPFVDSLP